MNLSVRTSNILHGNGEKRYAFLPANLRFYDGIQYNNRVDTFGERKLNAKVVDTILNSRSYGARLLGQAKTMNGKTQDFTLKVTDSAAGEFFVGLETLNSAASDTTITTSFAHSAFQQPVASSLLESLANSGEGQTIDLDAFKLEEGTREAVQRLGSAIYGTGSSNQPLGLGALVDDGTDVGTIGGQSRTTYTVLRATRTAATAGLISLTVLATLEDAISASGLQEEEPTINVTTKTIWTLYESLLTPTMRADYASSGYNAIPLRGDTIAKNASQLKGAAGFTVLSYRGKPVLKDDACTSGRWFMLNENYLKAYGRTVVPSKWSGKIEKVTLGEARTIEGTSASSDYMPPSANGWFFKPYSDMPLQAGMIARYYWVGQVCATQFRRHGVQTGVTTV